MVEQRDRGTTGCLPSHLTPKEQWSRKAPAALLFESHLQPSSNSGAAVTAWGSTGVPGKEQEELEAGGISSI